MKKDNIFIRMKNSLYNVQKIANYSKYGVGRAILYALLFCTFLGLIKAVSFGIYINNQVDDFKQALKQEKNRFTIQNYELNLKESPIKYDGLEAVVYANDKVSIQQEDKLKRIGVNSDYVILIFKDGIVFKANSDNALLNNSKFTYKQLQLYNMDNKGLISLLDYSKISTIIIFSIIIIMYTFVEYLFYAMLIALFSMFNNIIYKLELKYLEVFSLVIYAATLPNLVISIFAFFNKNTYFEIVGFIGTILYTLLVMKEMRNSKIDKTV